MSMVVKTWRIPYLLKFIKINNKYLLSSGGTEKTWALQKKKPDNPLTSNVLSVRALSNPQAV
jgi:hypothetical protein